MGHLSPARLGLLVLRAVSIPVMLASLFTADALGATTTVAAGADLQAALNVARPGDVLVLQAGARYVGPFTLPPNPTGPPITIRSSAALPERRIGPQDAALLPTLASPLAWAILDGTGASNWRLDGIAFEPVVDGTGEVILLQDSTNIYFDRLLIVGGVNGQKRGIRGNGQQITLTRSYIANSTPYGGTATALPGTIQAENFDDGSAGRGYADATAGNAGGKYRATDVDIESTSDGGSGYDVGWFRAASG
jgi:hypothetical protein